ncbi:transglutaminase family protein [Rhodopila globiformis]|uniref:IMP dehydrogenase n=1 Tax=Rhodopila globiformis TaxID=1071 RepID=A0A2S6NN24_RHOGL|nr:transglutaminase family protein [Rhodopila globiformis]PPQ38290.1 IMP dehydrogenase [Rhodopila globiformis]
MPLHVALTHKTSYHYDRFVALGPQTIRLRPAPQARTAILSYDLTVEPRPHFLNWMQDPQGNHLARVVFPEKVDRFEVTVDLVADMVTINPFDFFLEPDAETFPFSYDSILDQELAPFRTVEQAGPKLAELLAAIPREAERTVDKLVGLNQQVQQLVAYIVRLEPGVYTPEETLTLGKGSCRDSAWLMVQVLRHLGFAARFVSGYLIQLAPDVKPLEGPPGPSADFTDLHAWAEVYLPGAGWVGLDATSGLFCGEGHIPLAASPDPISAAPITGLVEKAEVTFDFAMSVTRIKETPRTTRPYTEAQWQAILAQGATVDHALRRGDVRLTMGGEPTFIAANDMDAPEWNTEALGPTKRAYAGRLIRRLMNRWSPGAVLTRAMGKHYPGEQLPRWALHCHWRKDGEAIWTDHALLASDDDRDNATAREAASFAASLAERLQVDPSLVIPAHEDIYYYLWKERQLPGNVVAEDNRLRDPLERARMVKVFQQGLASSVGSVLPLQRVIDGGARRWQSGRWFFRSGEMFLIPGDSPLGLRLPLDSLPWAHPDDVDVDLPPDPFAPQTPLPRRQAFRRQGPVGNGGIENFRPMPQPIPVVGQGDPGVVRTALTVESRDGTLHVFLPPLFAVEDWLALVAAIEDTAAETGRKVVLEGYQPPEDDRIQTFSVTPDPGVIEVNHHPTASWAEQVKLTEELYEEARIVGLATEKFNLDGRHVGTGGGNHVVMGGARAEDSPFLRRPDLLKSVVGFWHNHPSLSYLFSGQFIGPTSQHPRLDEARQDTIAELEIAFSHVKAKQPVAPWITDRLFRNILADMTGNTHRTEFCIDKMYTPDSASGRRGLVECRAFEMPPHAHMSAAQALLVRSAIAAFWERPYERRLIHWGTRIHDDFMLPHFVEQDFCDALEELGGLGFPLELDWFAPHIAFRFPYVGTVDVRGMQLEVRNALEPWHVLGEEQVSGGTARYVDSSVERVQARVSGWVDERYVLACNGAAVPLSRTDRVGEYVGGVRFKAWNPPSALHPTVGPHAPLTFDVYDRWNGRSLGGLTYNVSHPGGRSYETFPVNANEAEARRRARFFAFGHRAGLMAEPAVQPSREHPRTLDLRRV